MDDLDPAHAISRRTAITLWTAVAAGNAVAFPAVTSAGENKSVLNKDIVNKDVLASGEFPANPGTYLAGELVTVDAINRRGGLRVDGDFVTGRYHKAPPHEFALLPYGMVYYHGAPAELRDIPLGTHLHGSFYLPPKGEEATIPPTKALPKFGSKYRFNHAALLEDDFSFFQRRGWQWKVVDLDRAKGRLAVAAVGPADGVEFEREHRFWIDDTARVWQGRELVDWEAIATGQILQANLTWSPEWPNREFGVSDLWIDDESRARATERQRRSHVRYRKYRWLAGRIDHVEHLGGSAGIVTITLFGGMDRSLYDEVRQKQAQGLFVAAAEPTLRTYWQDQDGQQGAVCDVKDIADPPLGSSGIQIRWQTQHLLDGFRPTRIVRLRCHDWPNVKLPAEERLLTER